MKKDFKLIVLSGKARSGKNSTINFMKDKLGESGDVAEVMIAKTIKDYAKDYFGWDGSEETKPRKFLQDIGNYIRFELDKPNLLIDRTCDDIEILSNYFNYIFVSDCRFKNEINAFKERFSDSMVTIRLERTNYISELTPEQQQHITEIDLDDYNEWDYLIQAENLEELEDKIDSNILNNIANAKRR